MTKPDPSEHFENASRIIADLKTDTGRDLAGYEEHFSEYMATAAAAARHGDVGDDTLAMMVSDKSLWEFIDGTWQAILNFETITVKTRGRMDYVDSLGVVIPAIAMQQLEVSIELQTLSVHDYGRISDRYKSGAVMNIAFGCGQHILVGNFFVTSEDVSFSATHIIVKYEFISTNEPRIIG